VRAPAALAAVLLAATAAGAGAQSGWRDVTLSRQLSGEDSLVVSVRYGAGSVRIGSASGASLYRMQLRYNEESAVPLAQYEAGRLRVGVEGTRRGIPLGRGRTGGEMELELARNVPMSLDLDLGAVRADLDLGGLALRELQLRTGASETRLQISRPNPVPMRRARFDVGAADFTAAGLGNLDATDIRVSAGVGKVRLELDGAWRRDASLSVQMGLGGLELVFPEGLGVQLVRETFLTSLDPEGLVKRGDAYFSTDWETAERRVTVNVNAAFGSIKVLWMK
jgi:hypothetical protein